MVVSNLQHTSIGGYRIGERIGEGGMGVVYAATHELLGRDAAIKVLLRKYSHDQELVRRFFKEAKAAAAIEHPGIVGIFDFGYERDGSAYIAMERLEGESLEARIARFGALPLDQCLRFIGQLANVLGAAHAHGIVHRDLKPANVFIVADPQVAGGERVKILDFGVAKITEIEGPDMVQTKADAILGSPLYMAPEQIQGSYAVDERADLYALGCLGFEMLCGRPPLGDITLTSMAVMAMQLHHAPPTPSSLRYDIPPQVDALILALLAKEPAHRYQRAFDVQAVADTLMGQLFGYGGGADDRAATIVEQPSPFASGPDTLPASTAPRLPGASPDGWHASSGHPVVHPPMVPPGHAQASGQVPPPGHAQASGQVPPPRPERSSRARALLVLGLMLIVGAAIAVALLVLSGEERGQDASDSADAELASSAVNAAGDPGARIVNLDTERPQMTFRQLPPEPEPSGTATVPRRHRRSDRPDAAPDAAPMLSVIGNPFAGFSFSSTLLLSPGSFLRQLTLVTLSVPLLEPKTSWRIATIPAGAEVVNSQGEVLGTTPLFTEFDLAPLYRETFILRANGYTETALELSGGWSFEDTIELVENYKVTIDSAPEGATVTDATGREIGRTPLVRAVSKDGETVRYKLALDGYEPEEVGFVHDGSEPEVVTLTPLEAPQVTVRIESRPSGASVLRDGDKVGVTPWQTQVQRREDQTVTYTVELAGHRSQKLQVSSAADSEHQVELRPQQRKRCSPKKTQPAESGSSKPSIYNPYADDECQ